MLLAALPLLAAAPHALSAQRPDPGEPAGVGRAPSARRPDAAEAGGLAPRAAPPAQGAARQRPRFAVGEALLVNLAVNRTDAWGFGHEWARVGPRDWSRNLRVGWEWDENEFGTNMFAHPYHGALYFNAGRANGLDYWESAPLAFLGSWTWEYFGERYRPSLNDFFMTSFGGVVLGEVFHRVGASIRDNGASGSARRWREAAALPLDPVGGLNRLVRGEASALRPNPPEHDPGAYVLRVSSGARVVGVTAAEGRPDSISASPSILADLSYGDPLQTPYAAPFDVFTVRAQVSPGGGGLNLLRASGRLYGRDLDRPAARNRHVLAVNQRYDFASNTAYRFGGQSVEAGVHSRWRLGRTSALRTEFFLDGIVLGALDAPYAGVGERTYDFGPGAGFRTEIAYERGGITYVTSIGRSEYVHSVSGASADHLVSMGGFEATIPLHSRVGVGIQTAYYQRRSWYTDQPVAEREYPELRLFLTWTASAQPAPRR